ncbi:hypothetical protein IQ241_23320 [Romeria aff. gracilis LEGE 07310]|uniref:Uncharacterized protein n=1 Tax=Vasconcelosia minhoensis LEGE 07310 TaxID=915328 RepID=A0A8J7DDS4_9CYAN|nr:hypothetical protein [Romeria gracilis]MBE9080182.1 hypothetical protein [Romeria aff. gracilis LEGE 07310]
MSQLPSTNGAVASDSNPSRQLAFHDSYRCPMCCHGQLSGLTLMDAFACDFCRHIFTANLSAQSLQVADSAQPMAWRWNGQRWRAAQRADLEVTALIWLFGLSLACFPTGIIALSNYIFPPLESSSQSFPLVWTGLTFLIHGSLVFWLLAEHYQWPPYITAKIRLRRLSERLSDRQ